MRLHFFGLVFCLCSLPVFASDPLLELKDIFESERYGTHEEGALVLSKEQVTQEVIQSVSNCEGKSYSSEKQIEGDITTYAYTCKSPSNDLITSEVFVSNKSGRPELVSYQEIQLNSREMTLGDFDSLFLNSVIQSAPLNHPVSPGIRTLTTFAKVGVPVYLSFKMAKVISPIRTDWQKHFIAGALISGATILTSEGLIRAINKKRGVQFSDVKTDMLTSVAGLVASIGAGIAKEVYDKYTGRGFAEKEDAIYTAGGGFMVSATVAIPIELIFRSRNANLKKGRLL